MMRKDWALGALLGGLLLGLLTSCQSPLLLGQKGTDTLAGKITIRLAEANRAVGDFGYSTSDVGYLAVRLVSKETGVARFASATMNNGTATVAVAQLPAGRYVLQAYLYDWDGATIGEAWSGSDDPSQPMLLFYGKDTVQIQAGTGTAVSLLIYQAGDLSGNQGAPAAPVASVEVKDANDTTSSQLLTGQTLQLHSRSLDASTNDASVQSVVWTSSNPVVAEVNKNGLVLAKTSGQATITATSTEVASGSPSGQYLVTVEEGIYGAWSWDGGAEMGKAFFRVYRDNNNVLKWERTTGVGTSWPSKSRGLVIGAAVEGPHDEGPTTPSWVLFSEEFVNFTQTTVTAWTLYGNGGMSTPYPVVAKINTLGRLELPLGESNLLWLERSSSIPVTSLGTPSYTQPETWRVILSSDLLPSGATLPDLWWISSNTSIAFVDNTTGTATFYGTGEVVFTGYSIDDPTLPPVTLTVSGSQGS